jgi:hypothetical protein
MNNSNALEPRVSLQWNITEKGKLSIGYGLHSQLHTFWHYFLKKYTSDDKYDRENYIETNRNLDFTRSHHTALGYDHALSPDLRFKTEVYYQYLFDIPVESTPSYFSLINQGAGAYNIAAHYLENKGTARNAGIEFILEKFLSKQYYYLLTASLLDSRYKGSDGIERNTAFNSVYNINALFGYELPLREHGALDLNVRLVAAGGRRIVPLDEEATLQRKYEVYIYDEAFEHKLAPYLRADFRAAYKYNGQRVRHEVAFDITNLSNRPNEWDMYYNYPTQSVEILYQQGIFFLAYYRIMF